MEVAFELHEIYTLQRMPKGVKATGLEKHNERIVGDVGDVGCAGFLQQLRVFGSREDTE